MVIETYKQQEHGRLLVSKCVLLFAICQRWFDLWYEIIKPSAASFPCDAKKDAEVGEKNEKLIRLI